VKTYDNFFKPRRLDRIAKGICTNCGLRPCLETCKQCEKCHGYIRKAWKNGKKKSWEIIYNHYGNICACCGETNKKFLTVDHINNDGEKQRKNRNQGSKSTMSLARKIKRGKAPTDLQILCYNCNCGKQRNNGVCPHVG
jgi:hypothetical protein